LITSGHLLDYITWSLLGFYENKPVALLTFRENMLELWLLAAFGGDACPAPLVIVCGDAYSMHRFTSVTPAAWWPHDRRFRIDTVA
jgi:hypothetical protein